MTATGGEVLYSPELLKLAVGLADYPLRSGLTHRGEARSRTCGSEVMLACDTGPDHCIANVGMQVSACAVGQAAAAIFAGGAQGMDRTAIGNSLQDIERWLSQGGALPNWPGLEALSPALQHKGRHQAILLPWRAAQEALSNAMTAS